jgi:ParB-like chromosome segregation protein Spo0J
MSKLEIVEVPIEDLIPYANNARTHSDEQVAQIAASIKEFGWTNPILIDGENGIIAGHGRLAAARKLKMGNVPAIQLDGLNQGQKKALILADNKLALNSGWDYDLLKIEIQTLQEMDFNIQVIGFDESELNFNTVNYDALNDEDVDQELSDMAAGVKKAIQIEFDPEHYEQAQEIIKFWRSQGAYVGKMIIDWLELEKSKL